MKRLFFGIIFILLIMAITGTPQARVTGECSNCHTMHYSQGGSTLSEWGQNGPYKSLIINTCVGCHMAPSATQNDGTGTPYVHSIQAPTYGDTGTESTTNTLAGGSFYWMKTDKTTGHDVDGIATVFDMLPPGLSWFCLRQQPRRFMARQPESHLRRQVRVPWHNQYSRPVCCYEGWPPWG